MKRCVSCLLFAVLALLFSLFLFLVASLSPTTAISDQVTTPTPKPLFTPTPPPMPFLSSPIAISSHLAEDNDWASGGPSGANIHALAIHPTNPSVVFAGGDGGVHKTTDGGISWVAVKTGNAVSSLAIDPATPSTIFAGAWEGIYKSTDGGSNWTTVNTGLPYGPSVRALAIDPSATNIVYAGTLVYGVFKSTNGGTSWTSANTGLPSEIDVYALSIDPSSPSIIYAGTNAGVFKTTNAAQDWASVNTGLQSSSYYSVVVDPDTPNVVYAACLYNAYYAGVYRSTNGGTNWELANSGIVGADARALAVVSGVLYVATDGGIFRSMDGGRRWQGIYPDRPSSLIVRSLVVTTTTPQTIYAGANSYEASNRGVWQCTLTLPPPLKLLPTSPPKAVLIVGPIDAPENEATQAAIEAMETRAALLESHGLEVVRLYHPNATWQNIRANLSRASIVLYHGHGFGYNPDDANYLTTGGGNNGFCITDPDNLSGATLATQNMLIAYSQLARNAMVMNFACYSAGSSASDTTVVSEEVAKRRVNDYAYTFLTIDAGAYFAGGDWSYYLNYMLSSLDHTTGSAYQTAPGYNPAALRSYNHTQYPAHALWLDPTVDPKGQVLGWWSAFVGDPSLTTRQIFCFADINDDGNVDIDDVMLVASRWRTSCDNPDPDNNPNTPNYNPLYDIDDDCDIDIVDIMLVVKHWGETCS
jgi:photosystem II stability/assembly factor-like uncharacterized protein